MRQLRFRFLSCLFALITAASIASAQPTFVNGLVIPGDTLDVTQIAGANAGRFGQFSDLYYDPVRREWWALSDRGPGGGLIEYGVRVQRMEIQVDPKTGRLNYAKVKATVLLEDRDGLLTPPAAAVPFAPALNGLNPLALNGSGAILGRSFDPEGFVVDPRTGHFLVADEYGPSIYEFARTGRLIGIFQTPEALVPRPTGTINFAGVRDGSASGSGRQDNRGYEGLAISPDGSRLFAVLQDPLLDEGPRSSSSDLTDNDGRDGRHVRIVVFDNDPKSSTWRQSVAQYVYPLEAQAAIRARILAAGGTATGSDPRQGRNIGLSAIVAINDHAFLVLERDNRGIGVDNPAGRGPAGGPIPALGVVGSKRVYKIDLTGATDVSGLTLPDDGNLAAAGIVPVQKNDAAVFIDLAATTLLANGNQAEKWEGLTIGPRLADGGHVIVAGNDNDYSVTQTGSGEQFDVYVNFAGSFVRCVLDDPTRCEVDPAASDVVIDHPVALPAGYTLLPGVLHAYRAASSDLEGYVAPHR